MFACCWLPFDERTSSNFVLGKFCTTFFSLSPVSTTTKLAKPFKLSQMNPCKHLKLKTRMAVFSVTLPFQSHLQALTTTISLSNFINSMRNNPSWDWKDKLKKRHIMWVKLIPYRFRKTWFDFSHPLLNPIWSLTINLNMQTFFYNK